MSDRRKIITDHVYPPIPVRQFDWSATFDGYEPGEPHGHGATERDAINDLLDEADICRECYRVECMEQTYNEEGECDRCRKRQEADDNSQFGMGA